MKRFDRHLAVIAALMILCAVTACISPPGSTGNPELSKASQDYRDISKAYADAAAELHVHAATMTPDQRAHFRNDQMAEVAAADHLEESFAIWIATGVKPLDFGDKYATLKSAQQKVIDLNAAVNGKGATP